MTPGGSYRVFIELPRQSVSLYARDEDDAVFKAWNMIGLAGVKEYGDVRVVNDDDDAATPLWMEAHAACDGDRDKMWEWLEARYLSLLNREAGD